MNTFNKPHKKSHRKLILILIITSLGILNGAFAEEIPHRDARTNQGYIDVKDGKLFYKSVGYGTPIVIVHGGPGMDQTYLQPQLFEFATENQLIFYDQRGSGNSLQSVDDLANITMEQFISDIEKLRINLNLEKFILFGHSWGGLVSMHYALSHPENLHALILLSSSPANYKGMEAASNAFAEKSKNMIDDISPLFSYEEFEKQDIANIAEVYKKLFSLYFYNSSDVESLNLVFDNVDSARSDFKIREEMSKTVWMNPNTPDLLPKLKNFNIPTLIVHGNDDIIPVWTMKEIHSAIKNSQLIILEECGHFPYIEKPDKLKEVLNNFIKDLQIVGE